MNTQFKKGIVELCVLSLIKKKDMYGFEVIEILSKAIDVNENTVYPILRRLTSQNYFETYFQTTNQGAPRKYYRITNQGISIYADYIDEWYTFLKGVNYILGGNQNEK
ncbi:MAG: PadR family transcriptional regulator [Acholeplasmataceae bacterium]